MSVAPAIYSIPCNLHYRLNRVVSLSLVESLFVSRSTQAVGSGVLNEKEERIGRQNLNLGLNRVHFTHTVMYWTFFEIVKFSRENSGFRANRAR